MTDELRVPQYFVRVLEQMSAITSATVAATTAMTAHADQCNERERRNDEAHNRLQSQFQEHQIATAKAVDRIEHDSRNMRQEAAASNADFKRTVGADIDALRSQSQSERAVIGQKVDDLGNAVSGINTLLRRVAWSVLALLLAIVGFLLKITVFAPPPH